MGPAEPKSGTFVINAIILTGFQGEVQNSL